MDESQNYYVEQNKPATKEYFKCSKSKTTIDKSIFKILTICYIKKTYVKGRMQKY